MNGAGPEVPSGAAAYQAVPFKQTCLKHCRGPLSFFMQHWRDGTGGALRMGTRHGAYCVGCCWLLMLVLLALGVMSITWMAFVGVLIAGEKLLPWDAATRGTAVLLAALALALALDPASVPGLTLPGRM